MKKADLLKCVLAAALAVGVLSGCSNAPAGSTSSAGSNSQTNSGSGTPAADGASTITVGIGQSPNIQNLDTNYLTLLLEEKMKTDIQFDVFPAGDDFKTKFAMRVTSGTALPDVMASGFSGSLLEDYAAKGVFKSLDEYYADSAMTPNFHNLPEEDKAFLLNTLKISDGKIYSFFSYNTLMWNQYYHRAFINKEWLEKVNMEMPKTTDELTAVLKAFVNNDPNGNGKKDEMGLVGAKDGGYGQEVLPFIMSAFTPVDYTSKYLNVKDGKVYASYTLPEWKQGLEYMNMLVNEGLLSPLSFTQDYQQLKAMGMSEEAVAGMVTCGSTSNFGAASDPTCRRMSIMSPLTGPNGQKNAVYSPSLPVKSWFLTKDCRNDELAVKMGDLFLEPDMSTTARYGEKGVDWTDDPAVIEKYRAPYEGAGIPAKFVVDMAGNLWANPQNKHWYGSTPKYEVIYQVYAATVLKSDFEAQAAAGNALEEYNAIHLTEYPGCGPKEAISVLPYTTDELTQISVEKTAIDQYVVDQAAAFITGTRALTEWDTFQKELKDMGLDKYVQAAQQAYDRTK